MKKVLLIEDDLSLRENIEELLELSGYEVVTAPNGCIGVDLARQEAPDVIVCDIMMPEMDGYGVLKELSSDSQTQQIPFIFLSAKTERSEVRKGMDMGADDYLTKPFEEDELISAIESRLAKAQILANNEVATSLNNDGGQEGVHTLHQLKNFIDDHGTVEKYEKGAIIFDENAHANNVFLILKGVVKCYRMDEDGKELITSLHHADDFLGLTSFIDNVTYRESAAAVEEVELAKISKSELKHLVESNQDVSMELMELLSSNISEYKDKLLQMAYGSVRKKTARTLLQFAEILKKGPDQPINIARSDLASVAGIATESLIRTLSNFKKQGLIEVGGRNIKILDVKGLQSVI
ncbi:response regulator [Flagellimonas lutaonensis]|uniref:Transcriptional regulator n=1 Tax=Flagellimonas lutaonensis TaxID=516051 RepID=A0A0D5YVL2_9FLAO|nr:response regulator [Allomuricauda lutaonensis]AKA35929.1 transcriptional regulator [Allomuricauda lutaonensis]